jgi:hypothetical protein
VQRCTLRFWPCGISSWFSKDQTAVIVYAWVVPIDCCGPGSRAIGAAGDPLWQSSSPKPSSPGTGKDFDSTGSGRAAIR